MYLHLFSLISMAFKVGKYIYQPTTSHGRIEIPCVWQFQHPKWLDPWSGVACPLVRCPIHRDKLAHIVEDLRRQNGRQPVFHRQITEVSMGLIVEVEISMLQTHPTMGPLSFHGWVLLNYYKCKTPVKWSCLGGVCVVVL